MTTPLPKQTTYVDAEKLKKDLQPRQKPKQTQWPNETQQKAMNDIYHMHEEFKKQMTTPLQQPTSAIPLPIRVVENIAETADTFGTAAKTAAMIGAGATLGAAALLGAAKTGLNVVSDIGSAIIEPFKEKTKNKEEKMPINDITTSEIAYKFAKTASKNTHGAFFKLASDYDVEDFTRILKKASQITGIPEKIKHTWELPENALAYHKKYTLAKEDPDYHAKVPKSWSSATKNIDLSKITWVGTALAFDSAETIEERKKERAKQRAKELEEIYKERDKQDAIERERNENLRNKMYPNEVPKVSEDFEFVDSGPKSKNPSFVDNEKYKEKESAPVVEASVREKLEPEYNRLYDMLNGYLPTHYTKRGEHGVTKLGSDLREFSTLQQDMGIFKEPTEEAKRNALFEAAKRYASEPELARDINLEDLKHEIEGTSPPASSYREYLKTLSPQVRKDKELELRNVAEHEGISIDEAYKKAEEIRVPVRVHNVDPKISGIDELYEGGVNIQNSTSAPIDASNLQLQGTVGSIPVNQLMSNYDKLNTSNMGTQANWYQSSKPRVQAAAQAAQVTANEKDNWPGNPGFTIPQPPPPVTTTPINLNITPTQSTSGLVAEVGQNLLFDGASAAVAGTMLASGSFGSGFGAYLFSSLYNNYLRDIAQQNQQYQSQASSISNQIKATAVQGVSRLKEQGVGDYASKEDRDRDFLEGKSNPTKRSRDDQATSAERMVRARNEFNDLGFEAQKMNPLTTVSDFNLVSQEVSQAFAPRQSTDLVKQSQQDYQSWFRNSAPYATR